MTRIELRAFVDRVEGEVAVLILGEEGCQVNWPACALPQGTREGSELILTVRPATDANELGSIIDRLKRGD